MKYYLYNEQGYYTGESVESEEPVERGFEFEPQFQSLQPGFEPWFDGFGWRAAPNYQSTKWKFGEAKEHALMLVAETRFVSQSQEKYSPAEQATFDAQYAEAQVVQSGGEPGVYLQAISNATGEPIAEIASKIMQQRAAYDAELAQFAARLQALRHRIVQAPNKSKLPSYAEIIRLQKV